MKGSETVHHIHFYYSAFVFLDGFTTSEVDYQWKRNKVVVAQPIMAQFAIISSKVLRRVDKYTSGMVFLNCSNLSQHAYYIVFFLLLTFLVNNNFVF